MYDTQQMFENNDDDSYYGYCFSPEADQIGGTQSMTKTLTVVCCTMPNLWWRLYGVVLCLFLGKGRAAARLGADPRRL